MSSFDRFLQIQENLLGVDLGYDSVKIVALKKRGNQNYLKSFNIVNIPAKANQQKDIADRVIADAIKNACRTARPRIFEKTAVSGLPESKVFTKIIQIPKMTDEELAVAVPTEAARHIPIPQNELYLDWFSLGPASQNSLNVLIVAAPRYLVDNYFKIFKSIGIDLIALETKPIAAARAIAKKGEQGTFLILDIGAAAIGISIYDVDSIKFTYTVPHGGNTLTKSLANSLKITDVEAEKLKRETGFKKDPKLNLIAAMSPVINDVIEEINNAIKFYETRTKPARKISEIRLCGGGALTPEIATYLTETTGKKTNIANPFVNIASRTWRKMPQEQILRLTTAAGLALRDQY
ncbi:MAG TPA: type IV pilus assembly protein PilM [Patescibacteria group bacterium]|nr:type IV pilus assembly protein PilM [Patescibacteria group bacterium]